jgi:redox-sensitive bicupin YhaK (pirin superfamily)
VKNDRAYVHVVRGRITVNGHVLQAGDALKTEDTVLELEQGDKAEVLVFDLPE